MGSVKLEHWWIGLVVAGGAVMGAAKLAPDPTAAFALGLGLLLFGIGEWMNHPVQSGITDGMGQVWKVTGHPRRASLGGSAFSLCGLLLLGGGVVRVAIALFQ